MHRLEGVGGRMLKGIVDRIESGVVTVEVEGLMIDVPLPKELTVREGDMVALTEDRTGIVWVDLEGTASRKRDIESLFERLKK